MGSPRFAICVATAVACVTVASASHAQTDPAAPLTDAAEDPGPACAEATADTDACDTEYTPVAKDAADAGFDVLGGADFEADDGTLHESSPTPYTVDFFTNAFAFPEHGFFAGAQCRDPDAPFESTAPDSTNECERVPAIYEYTVTPGQPGSIEQVLGPEASTESKRGYVAEIAWITPQKAIAVGGTGEYPRRELPRESDGETDAEYAARDLAAEEENAAGAARVWLYGNGSWSELTDLPETDAGEPMAALTTVDCSPRLAIDGELCVAGGMRQLWHWQGDRFTKSFTPTSVDAEGKPTVDDGAGWRFRVRSVRFRQGHSPSPQAVAVTSGCCAGPGSDSKPRGLLMVGPTRWASRLLQNDPPVSAKTHDERNASPPESLVDSYYALDQSAFSVIATSGAPEGSSPPEPPSRIIRFGGSLAPYDLQTITCPVSAALGSSVGGFGFGYETSDYTGHICRELANPRLTSMRLHAGDGDTQFDPGPQGRLAASGSTGSDKVMDWAVGVLRSSGQGIAYRTYEKGTPAPNPSDCPATAEGLSNPAACQPRAPGEIQGDTRSRSLFSLPTYALNSFAFVPDAPMAWAAGDRGTIARLGGEGDLAVGSTEPTPPRLGAGRPESLPDSSAYDAARPDEATETGAVPSAGSMPTTQLEEPQLIPAGVPELGTTKHDVNAIVMSRDGAEGWALGAKGTQAAQGTIMHYTDGRWQACETVAIPGQTDADPACEELAALHRGSKPVEIRVAARIPLERDADPTNDDEFEAVAFGSTLSEPGKPDGPAVLRYRNGRWQVEREWMRQIGAIGTGNGFFRSVAFTAPDRGWLYNDLFARSQLLTFDGERWFECSPPRDDAEKAACGSPPAEMPIGIQPDARQGTFGVAGAGQRIYYYGAQKSGDDARTGAAPVHPFIYSIDYSTEHPVWLKEHNPGCVKLNATGCETSQDQGDQGAIFSLSVADGPEGPVGWAVGDFGPPELVEGRTAEKAGLRPSLSLMRLTHSPGGEARWTRHTTDDAAAEYLHRSRGTFVTRPTLLSLPGTEEAFIGAGFQFSAAHPMLRFDPGAERWGVQPTPFFQTPIQSARILKGLGAGIEAMAPDGQGGFWLAARVLRNLPTRHAAEVAFYHYTDRAPAEVFEEAPHGIREPLTDIAPAPDGRLWAASESATVYRYDRALGWDAARIPGWDPGRVVTNPSAAAAVAVGPDGSGVVVGEGGRIANIESGGTVRLDRAAGARAVCDQNPDARPCGTGRDLTSAAVAPDGSAMVGGEGRALLFRPPGGEFGAIAKPQAPLSATFTDIAMPIPGRAWVTTSTGQVFAGEGSGSGWSWELENRNEIGQPNTLDASGRGIPLNAITLDASGHGYAVGGGGIVLERTGEGPFPWRRVDSGVVNDLYSVALPRTGQGPGVLIGGELGLILTLADGEFEIARGDDLNHPLHAALSSDFSARVVGLALQPGTAPGEVEAWAALRVPDDGGHSRFPAPWALLRYASADEPAVAGPGAAPLADFTAHDSDLSLAAFGRSDCHLDAVSPPSCPEMHGTTLTHETVSRSIVAELGERAGSGLDAALFTGDVARAAGRDENPSTPVEVDVIHRRWSEFVASELDAAGVPLFGAIGARDLGQAQVCPASSDCPTTRSFGLGTTEPWRKALAGRAAPWGEGGAPSGGDVSFEPTPGQEPLREANEGEAKTHYAAEVLRGGEPVARLIVLDNSTRSLSASDPQQNPTEVQSDFLERMLCRSGEGEGCTRGAEQEAIVAMNTPTYSYEAEASGGGVETAADAAALETQLLQHDADLVISGRLGWNGLYHTLAPGLHCPAPGGEHPDPTQSPSENAAASGCAAGAQDVIAQAQSTAEGAAGLAASTPTGELPTVVASGAGGTFGPMDEPADGEASQGFWHGYSLAHLDTETGKVTVEQRPVFDWLSLTATDHAVGPRQRLTLEGEGREVAGADTPLRYDAIDSHAITHRYDLLLADPDQPWLPCAESDAGCLKLHANISQGEAPATNECSPYLCLPGKVGTVNRVSGELRAGDGRYPQTFAVAMLSVADKSATYPLVFERSPSFVVKSALRTLGAPVPNKDAGATAPPPPPTPDVPQVPEIKVPAVPVPPAIPLLAAASPPEPQAPVPPAPPPPAQQPSPLDLSVAPTGVSVTPPTALIQPPTPPVNPAPPGGARREARQRQAAAQKSGADADSASAEGSREGSDNDLAQAPPGSQAAEMSRVQNAFTARRNPGRGPSFTVLASAEQPSAWTRGALYGGGLTLIAAAMALGFATLRPRSRGGEPLVPAPARARSSRAPLRRP